MIALTASWKTSVLAGISAMVSPLRGGFGRDEPCPMARVGRMALLSLYFP
jgi:hypothetical protein